MPGGSAPEPRLLAGVPGGGAGTQLSGGGARPVGAALGEVRLLEPAAWGSSLSWSASARPARQTFLVDPSARRRAVDTSSVLVWEPHPSGDAESTRATSGATGGGWRRAGTGYPGRARAADRPGQPLSRV